MNGFFRKYHFSKRDAIRLGISIELGNSDFETNVTRLNTVYFGNSIDDSGSFSFIVNTQYIRYITVTDHIAFYGGVGPFIRFFNMTAKITIKENGTEIKRKTNRNGINTGLDIILEVEWWFHKYMSLSAEY